MNYRPVSYFLSAWGIIKNYVLFDYFLYKYEHRKQPIHFIGFWEGKTENYWFYNFIAQKNLLQNKPNLKISFFSVFETKRVINLDRADIKVFYTGENLKNHTNMYQDHGLSAGIDLALGFDYLHHPRYLRFPLWLLYMIGSNAGYEDIVKFCESFNVPNLTDRPFFASLVARHDQSGIRNAILRAMEQIDFVHCAGSWNNNTNLLFDQYNDNKKEFLKVFKFNICPENSNAPGYVTEKLFQAFAAGCIPIYYGSDNNPEPGIINRDAVIFWNPGGNNDEALALIEQLHKSPTLYKEFIQRPKLLPSAPEKIYQFISDLESRLVSCIENART